jgi:hypothetical protein
MLNLTDSATPQTIPGFIALKIDKTAEIKIHDETHTSMHHDAP